MNDLDNISGINTIPILSGNCTLCVFSIIVNIIQIRIIISLKFLNSILYRLLFIISINEIINCFFHIFQSFLVIFNLDIKFIYILDSLIIYFTDTLSMILLACLCDSMKMSILKHNKNVSKQSYKIFSLIFASVLTVIYFILYIINNDEQYIYTELISWRFLSNINLKEIDISTNSISYFLTIVIYSLIILYSFLTIIKIQNFIKEKNKEEEKSKNRKKLNEFRYKMIKYPLYGALWVIPLIIYSFFEYVKKNNNKNDNSEISEKILFLRIKYLLYFNYSFISSIRGILFFKLFISNERIKKLIQYKIRDIIFFKNILKDEFEEDLQSSNSNTYNNESNKIKNEINPNFNEFQEGLIDDRDLKNKNDEQKNDKNNEEDSDSDDENNIKNMTPNINTMPNNDILVRISTLSESNKDTISDIHKGKRNPINDS